MCSASLEKLFGQIVLPVLTKELYKFFEGILKKRQIWPIAKFVNNPGSLFYVWLSIYCILYSCTKS